MDNSVINRDGHFNRTYSSYSSSSQRDVRYSCGACGYELNLSSSNRNTSSIGSKYGKSMKRGIISFFNIDDSRFTQVDEIQCVPHFHKHSWGLFRRRTKLLCRKCGNHIGNAHNGFTSSLPLESDSAESSPGSKMASRVKYDIRICALQPSSSNLESLCLLEISATTVLNPVSASTNECYFPAIFNFGDSNSDTGGLAASLIEPTPPYGETYFHRPAGRFSDGRLIIDFIAQSFGLPYLSAYLDSLGTNFSYGANFATASSTVRLPSGGVIPQLGGFSPFYLNIQYTQFRSFKSRTQFVRHQGGLFASLMPKEEYFREALYTFDIGQNDLGAGIFGNLTVQQINASVPEIVSNFSKNVKDIYNLGARSFWIHNTGPIGCLPYIFVNFPSTERDGYGCAKPYNEVAQYFNNKLKEAVVQLRKELPLTVITYVDIYSVKYSLFSNPKKYGFEHPLVACCGYGGEYNYSSSVDCGGTIEVNGTKIFVGSCERPYTRVNWDGVHYTEAANKFIFDQISTGAFSDPPIPLNMACHKNSIKNYS